MATEEKRILKMAYLLLQSNGYLKAGDLARELNLSERTIKNDIEHLRVFLKECGCTLDSVRGKGYILQIDEPDQFAKIREWLNILFNNVENNTRERLSYQLARAIMCRQATDEDGYFLLDELAAQLYCSSSTVKKKMTWVREFLKSFGISLISRPGHGMKLCGDEFSQRLCMLELYENHFRIRVVAFNDQVYERAFRDRGDKDKVRKTVLDTIRASENELFDTYINRLVDYVLLLRNRIQSGNLIEADSERWSVYRKKLPLSKEWTLAVKLLENLKNISGYLQDISNVEGEIAALAALFLMWGDWEQMPELKKRFSIFYTKAKNLTEQVVENLKEQWKVPDEISNSQLVTALIPDMLRLLFQKNFGYADCFMLGNSISENAIKRSPFVLALADSIGEFLSHKADLKINEYNTQLLGVSLYKILNVIDYPYVPRKILLCARNGKSSAQIIAKDIVRRLGDWWIGKMEIYPFYDARKLPVENYDWVIGSFNSYAYHYTWSYLHVHAMMTPEDIEQVRRQVLLSGYDLFYSAQQLKWDELAVHRDFSICGIQSIFQLLSYQWGKDINSKEVLNQFFMDPRHLRVRNQLLCVIVPSEYTEKRIFDLYFLKKGLEYEEEMVRAVLFIAIDFQESIVSMRFLENGIRYLQDDFEQLSPKLTTASVMEVLIDGVRKRL